MDSSEIRRIAIDSAENYYRYLEQNNKGLQEVKVFDITAIPVVNETDMYRLRLSAKLFDIEAVIFKLLTTGKTYSTGEIKIIEYDPDKNTLLIKPEINLTQVFRGLQARDINVISDLKFLVERVRKWYELKGSNIRFPEKASVLSNTCGQIKYLPDVVPSAEQAAALNLLFTTPFSYIWGAPGTGKTQFVLSYALLHYIEHNKKVAIMAPTNNAIEQVLRGVLKMTDKAGVPRSKILRLGTPSRKFAEDYPEVCEERGVMKKLEELNKKIEKLRELLTYTQLRERLDKTSQQLELFSTFKEIHKTLQDIKTRIEKSQDQFKKTKEQLAINKNVHTEVASRKLALQKKVNGIGTKLYKLFGKKTVSAEIELGRVNEWLVEVNAKTKYLEEEYNQNEIAFNKEKSALADKEQVAKRLVSDIKETFNFTDGLKNIVNSLNETNWQSKREALERQIGEEKNKCRSSNVFLQEYELATVSEINMQLEKLEAVKKKLGASSTEERIKGVNIVAATLDSYIGRFAETTLEVDHVFIDEAGYSNIIKAATLFTLKAPVTFLGDHKQLPPVCEINDSSIQQVPEYNNIFLWAQSAIFLEGLFSQPASAMLQQYLQQQTISNGGRMQRINLTSTFRFGKRLAEILDRHVYNTGFKSSLERGDTKIFFIHAPKTDGFKSRTSITEAQAIRNLIKQFKQDEDFIILTPYKKQVDSLGKIMPAERNDLKILTVHGSQGREWNTVILSVVDTGDKWFVDSMQPLSNGLNLLNTAVSRTQQRLIIVCDYQFWKGQNGQLISDLLGVAEEMKIAI